MTVNALLSYLGFTLLPVASIFFAIGLSRFRNRSSLETFRNAEEPERTRALLAAQRADLLCGAVLLVLALALEAVSLMRGGPAAGVPTGNTAGGALAIVLASGFCVIVCLVVRHMLVIYMRRSLDA
jgi:hypothetical protein